MSDKEIGWSSFRPTGNEARYLQDAFDSGWISGGGYINKLEAELDHIFAGSKCFAVSNGTSALQLAFQTLGVEAGSRVIVPAFCFQAAGNVLSQLGAEPVFCDVDSSTWNQTVDSIERAMIDGVVGIVVVHNYGRAAPSEEIVAWAKAHNLWVIEDCAEAWFSKYNGRYVGLFGDIATFSMHATKTIAAGEGGVVMINDHSLTERLRLLRSHGLDRSKTHYLHELAGNNYRLSNLLAAVAYGQLECRSEIEANQKARMEAYYRRLNGHWAFELQTAIKGASDNLWAVGLRLNSQLLAVSRDQLIAALNECGIETRPGFYPASALHYNTRYLTEKLSVSEAIAKDVIVLPCSANMTQDDISYVCDVLERLLDTYSEGTPTYSFVDLRAERSAIEKLTTFLLSLGKGIESFRYFQNRSLDVVRNHDVSILLETASAPIGYGHIETESGVSWLGIAVAEGYAGKGWGKLIMTKLISDAMSAAISRLHLKVDRANFSAVGLYQSFGFVAVETKSDDKAIHMERTLVAAE